MNYKVYYYEEEKVCIISELFGEKPTIETLSANNSNLKISLNEKNVENIFSFFKENTIKQLLSQNPEIIDIDYSEIINLPIYTETSFKKLLDLIADSTRKCNDTINKYIENKDALKNDNT